MKAITYEAFRTPLLLTERPTPVPQPTEVLIKIHYTAVNPVDWKIREGLLAERMPHHFPLIPGWDAAGTIAAVGERVTQFHVGDEVYAYCRKETISEGTYAEYVTFDASGVALKPKNCSFAESASLPLVALTAWQALFDVGRLEKGQKILIHAGAGGVGSIAIQLAKWAGAFVITTAGPDNLDYVKSLGADFVINYRSENVNEKLKELYPQGIDFVLDMLGGKTLRESALLLKKGGCLVSIYEKLSAEEAQKLGIRAEYVFVRPNGQELAKIAQLIEEGRLKVPFIEQMSLEEAAEAQEKNKQGHTRGKIVLKVAG